MQHVNHLDRERSPRFAHWRLAGVFLAYQLIAIFYYGRALIFDFTGTHAGNRLDPQIFVWSMAWWPHALRHGLDLFHTRMLWAPEGVNLMWVTSVPLQSFAAAPITARFGPVAAYNLVALMLPALGAFTAFIFAHRLVGATGPAILCGYLFGFSPYMIGQQVGGHIHMTPVFLVPVVLGLVLARIDAAIGKRSFVVALAAILIGQFLLGLEIFATLLMFGAIALALAYFMLPELRERLREVSILVLISVAIAGLALSPLLLQVARGSRLSSHGFWNTTAQAVDFLEPFIPANPIWLGTLSPMRAVAAHYSRSVVECGGYVGIPLLIILAIYLKSHWDRAVVRLIAIMLGVLFVASLGSRLHIAGHELFGMPWKILSHLPLINSALPDRFTLYIHLIVAIVAALYFAESGASTPAKIALGALIVLSVMPDLSASRWSSPMDTPSFFRSESFRARLKPGETLLILPYGQAGNSMYWQAETGLYFAIAEGWTGPIPESFLAWPVVEALLDGGAIPAEAEQLNAFLATHQVTAIVFRSADPSAGQWLRLLASSGAAVETIDDVVLARPAAAAMDALRNAHAIDMECRVDSARFQVLLDAANRYVESRADLAALTPLRAQQHGMLPAGWTTEDGEFTRDGLWLGAWNRDRISVGVRASLTCAQALVARYGPYADEVYFPYPHRFEGSPAGDTFQRKFVMVIRKDALAGATQSR